VRRFADLLWKGAMDWENELGKRFQGGFSPCGRIFSGLKVQRFFWRLKFLKFARSLAKENELKDLRERAHNPVE